MSKNYDYTPDKDIEYYADNGISDKFILIKCTVSRVLSDDTIGDRHQRFIVKLDSGKTLLVAHNIDVTERVDGLFKGDVLYIKGEFEWSEEGGVLHWTHTDKYNKHPDGWIEKDGKKYR